MPTGTPVEALWGGQVVEATRTQWSSNPNDTSGGLVTILADIPGIGQEAYYTLHLDTVNVAVGQIINPGTIIGTSGGQLSGGNWNVSPQYSTGPHIEIGFNGPYLFPTGTPGSNIDPTNLVTQAAQSLQGITPSNNVVPLSSGITIPGTSSINPSAITNGILNALAQSDVVQRAGIMFVGLTLVLIGMLGIFIASGGIQKTEQATQKGAEVAALA